MNEYNRLEQVEENKRLLRKMMEYLDSGNIDGAVNMLSPDCIFNIPDGRRLDFDGYNENIASKYFTAFPDLKHNIEDIIAEDNKVMLRMTEYGTHTGDYMGISPTGKKATWAVTAIYDISNNKVVEVWVLYDTLSLIQQLESNKKD